ncbi:MAG: RraA family protein [Pseudomonadota bacterium]
MTRFEIERPPKKIVEDLSKMYSGIIQDACDEVLGHSVRTWMDVGLRPIFDEAKLIGPAVTLRMVPPSFSSFKGRSGLSLAFEAIDMAQAGDVFVVGGGLTDCGMWGEMMTITGTVKGLGGAVVDGGVRDVLAIREMKFPLFYRNPVVTTGQTRLDTVSVNEPIQCGGRLVCPGDLVFGDYDGITVVPRDSIEKIYSLCLQYLDIEKKQRAALKQGMKLAQLKEDIL